MSLKWYAIRTAPGAQRPQREYWKEPSASALKGVARGQGYRIVSGVNPERSAIELALEGRGFAFYMPAEYEAVRNRHRKGIYELRRFPLMKGYAFVGEIVTDEAWGRLLSTPGVQGVISSVEGKPFPISMMDIHRLRMFEAYSRAEATNKAQRLTVHEAREGRRNRSKAARAARKRLFAGRPVRLLWGDKVGHDATVAAWHDEEYVRVLVQQLDAAPEMITVPYSFLKAAE